MKHILATLVIASVAATSQAQGLDSKQKDCVSYGNFSKEIFLNKQQIPRTKLELIQAFQAGVIDVATLESTLKMYHDLEDLKPSNAQSAYALAFAKCMKGQKQ